MEKLNSFLLFLKLLDLIWDDELVYIESKSSGVTSGNVTSQRSDGCIRRVRIAVRIRMN